MTRFFSPALMLAGLFYAGAPIGVLAEAGAVSHAVEATRPPSPSRSEAFHEFVRLQEDLGLLSLQEERGRLVRMRDGDVERLKAQLNAFSLRSNEILRQNPSLPKELDQAGYLFDGERWCTIEAACGEVLRLTDVHLELRSRREALEEKQSELKVSLDRAARQARAEEDARQVAAFGGMSSETGQEARRRKISEEEPGNPAAGGAPAQKQQGPPKARQNSKKNELRRLIQDLDLADDRMHGSLDRLKAIQADPRIPAALRARKCVEFERWLWMATEALSSGRREAQ